MTRRTPGAGGWRREPAVLIEDQDRPLAWVDPPDPGLRYADDDDAPAWVPHRSRSCAFLAGLLTGGLVGLIVGVILAFLIAAATPRSAATAIPAITTWSGTQGPVSSGNPSRPSTAPPAARAGPSVATDPDGPLAAVTRSGTIAWAAESLGRNYLAIPIGPGHRVTVCGPGGCWTTVSTDAGPALFRQREGRIADVAVGQWERICGVPRSLGLCQGSWTVSGPGITPPATETGP